MTTATTGTNNQQTESQSRALDADTLKKWLRDMMLIREFEVRSMQSYQDQKIGGFCHIYSGQEAVAVGCIAAVNHDDPVITAYRDHGHALARGMHAKYCMAELYGRIGGCAKGKGGSMHMFDKANHLYGGHGIVGAHTPLGNGLAFAHKYFAEVINEEKVNKVTLCFFGDGALNQGPFHESMNMASLFDLPIVFICENNGYAMGTSVPRGTSRAHDIAGKSAAYDIEGYSFDGMDVLNVYDNFKPLVDQCRENSRPVFVELKTYRYMGHSMSDPRKYRTKEEEEEWGDRDPINKLSEFLREHHGFSEDDHKAMQKDVRKEVRDAMKWADESPFPDVEQELYHDVYVNAWGPYNGTSLPMMLNEEQE